jgi:hypothetical protein
VDKEKALDDDDGGAANATRIAGVDRAHRRSRSLRVLSTPPTLPPQSTLPLPSTLLLLLPATELLAISLPVNYYF